MSVICGTAQNEPRDILKTTIGEGMVPPNSAGGGRGKTAT